MPLFVSNRMITKKQKQNQTQTIHMEPYSSVEEMEASTRVKVLRNPFTLFLLSSIAAVKVMVYYMCTYV